MMELGLTLGGMGAAAASGLAEGASGPARTALPALALPADFVAAPAEPKAYSLRVSGGKPLRLSAVCLAEGNSWCLGTPAWHEVQVLRGGPVETGRGFVLHSADYFADASTLPIDQDICLTHTVDVLRAIAFGEGPRKAVLALGYAGWGAGQLESEIKANGWLHCEADPALLFDPATDTKYQRALSKLGIDQGLFSGVAGRA